jgi:hypothetical protein
MSKPGFTADAALPTRPLSRMSVGRHAAVGSLVHPQLTSVDAHREAAVRALEGVAVYGNWCGPGHVGPDPPIDAVDEACCRHDQCYCEEGALDCGCNRELYERLPGAIADSSTPPEGKAWGLAIIATFASLPCLCHEVCGPDPTSWPPWSCWDLPVPVPSVGGICPFPFA